MALTNAQRTSMFEALAGVMGQDDAENLMQQLPPGGWDNVATKEDLRAGFAETNAAIAAGLAQAAVERAEIRSEAALGRAEIVMAMTAGLAQAAVERAEIGKTVTERLTDGLAQAAVERAEIRSEAALGRAEIIRRQVWHLYIVVATVVSTVALSSVSIWIALLTQS